MKTNSEWTRDTITEDTYDGLHEIKPQIYRGRVSGTEYSVKIINGSDEYVITETLYKGLTKSVMLQVGGEKLLFPHVYDAECYINEKIKANVLNTKEVVDERII